MYCNFNPLMMQPHIDNYIMKLNFFLLFSLMRQSNKGYTESISELRLFKASAAGNRIPQKSLLFFNFLLQLISEAQFTASHHPKHREKLLERRKDAIIVQDLQVKCRKLSRVF